MSDTFKRMLDAANESRPVDFQAAVADELNSRIMDQIEGRRAALATSIFAKDYEPLNADVEAEEEEEDVDEDI